MQVLWLLIRSTPMISLETKRELSSYPIRTKGLKQASKANDFDFEDRPKLRIPNLNLDTLIALTPN